MQDEADSTEAPAAADRPIVPTSPSQRGGSGSTLMVALLAFIVGGAIVAWLAWRGDLDPLLPRSERQEVSVSVVSATGEPQTSSSEAAAPDDKAKLDEAQAGLGSIETRLALLEDRFSRIGLQASAAGANASRAEALLIALAARRRIDRGEPLGYVEDQLKLRFGGAQPQAVRRIIAASKNPVTLYLLSSQLDAAAPSLVGARTEETSWMRMKREIASLFVIRRSASNTSGPLDRVDRAQMLLKAGKIDEAIAEVQRLPGASDAQDWVDAARRYEEAQHALDVIETTAMLEPRHLRDDNGEEVDQPSPLYPPVDETVPTD